MYSYFPNLREVEMRELTEIEEVAAGYDWAGLAGAMAGTAVVGGMYGLAGSLFRRQ